MSFYKIPKNLTDLNHFRSNPMVQFKEETVGGVEVVIPCYMIADADLWKQPFANELRGHVFRKDTGELISAALPKFFNVGENANTQRHILPWDEVSSVADKRDGCFSGDTLLLVRCKTLKEEYYSSLADLVNDIENKQVFSYNERGGHYEFTDVIDKLVKQDSDKKWLLIETSAFSFKCTEDHKILTSNRGWVEAKDLTIHDSLM